MKYFAISRTDGVDFNALKPHLRHEAGAVWGLYRQGILREFYLRADGPGVILVFESESAEKVRSHLAGLPLAQRALIEFDVIPVGPLVSLESLMSETPWSPTGEAREQLK